MLFAGAADPSGSLSVSSDLVRAESHVELNWAVDFPAFAEDPLDPIVELPTDNSDPEVRQDVEAEIRVLGAGFGPSWNEFWVKGEVNWGEGWKELFEGRGAEVNPEEVVQEPELEAGDRLSFRFQGAQNSGPSNKESQWRYNTILSSSNDDDRLMILKNGDVIPNTVPAFDQGEIQSFLTPYLADDGVTLELGPRDLIVLTELSNLYRGDSRADFQDLVILVTFKTDSDDDEDDD